MANCRHLTRIIRRGKRLIVFLHDNPDPDALAAGWLLRHIAAAVGVRAHIVFGGQLGRAENRAMVQLLRIPARRLADHGLKLEETDVFALIDTQPGTGNNSFPSDRLSCSIVVDHHPLRKASKSADFLLVRSDQGCSTTLMLDLARKCGLELDPDMATAALYAIMSETQDLGRDASKADLDALQALLPLVRWRSLGRIRHPRHERATYRAFGRALHRAEVSKHVCICHIGEVPHAELVAEIADFLGAMERISWCLATGLVHRQLFLSIRTTRPKGHPERAMRAILGKRGKGGGHGTIAGGMMPCENLEMYGKLAAALTEAFLRRTTRLRPESLHPLLASDADGDLGPA